MLSKLFHLYHRHYYGLDVPYYTGTGSTGLAASATDRMRPLLTRYA